MNPSKTGTTLQRLEVKLRQEFEPVHLDIEDESHKHLGHPGAIGGGGHYQVTIVSAAFEDKSLVEQHRMVNRALRDLMNGEIHALGLSTIRASQWSDKEKKG